MTFHPPVYGPNIATDTAVALNRVSLVYGSFVALREISLALDHGSSAVLLGPNGAGKSTLLKILAGLASPSYGKVEVFGLPPRQQRGRVAYMAHQTMLYDELSASENLHYFLGLQFPALSTRDQAVCVRDALEEVGLEPSNLRRVGEYSQGMRQRTALARVLLTDPDLLLLDEPFSNLDTTSAQTMVHRLGRWLESPSSRDRPRTMLLTTHQATLAEPLAQLTLLLEAGRLVSVVEKRTEGFSSLNKAAVRPEVLR